MTTTARDVALMVARLDIGWDGSRIPPDYPSNLRKLVRDDILRRLAFNVRLPEKLQLPENFTAQAFSGGFGVVTSVRQAVEGETRIAAKTLH